VPIAVPTSVRRAALVALALLAVALAAVVAVPDRAGAQPSSIAWVTPQSHDFGAAVVGGAASPAQSVTVTNIGMAEMDVVVDDPGAPFDLDTTDCTTPLTPGASCTASYTFTAAAAGEATGTATITATSGPTTEGFDLALMGLGLNAGDDPDRLQVTPRDLDFGPVAKGETAPAQQVTVTNITPDDAAGIAVADPTNGAFSVDGTCADPLPAGSSCTFDYAFTAPSAVTSTATSTITVPGGPVEISLAGHTTGLAGGDGYFVIEEDGDLYAFGAEARSLLKSLDPAATDDAARETTISKLVGPLLAGETAVDFELTADRTGMWILDSAGVIHEIGGAPDAVGVDPTTLVKTVDGQPEAAAALARVGGNDLWVFSNAGRVTPQFGTLNAQAQSDMQLVLSKDLWGGINDAKPTVNGTGVYALASDGGVFAYNAQFLGNPYTGIAERLGVPVGSVGPDLPVSGITVDPDGRGYWIVGQDGGVFAFEAPFVGSLPAIIPFEQLFAPVNGMVPYGNGYLLVAEDGGVFTFSDRPFRGSASGLADTKVVDISVL